MLQSLETALWAFSITNDFRAGCFAAANLGEDADTIATIYGPIAGAVYCEKAIPTKRVANAAPLLKTILAETHFHDDAIQ